MWGASCTFDANIKIETCETAAASITSEGGLQVLDLLHVKGQTLVRELLDVHAECQH